MFGFLRGRFYVYDYVGCIYSKFFLFIYLEMVVIVRFMIDILGIFFVNFLYKMVYIFLYHRG